MNRIKFGDVITLSDHNEYVVAGMTNYEGKEYLYLVDINKNQNIKFVVLHNTKVLLLSPRNDWELINLLLPRFLDNTKEFINFDEKE